MNIEEILSEWSKDSYIDKTSLDDEDIKTAMLHHKYYSELINENLRLVKKKNKYNKLMLEKWEFYTEGAKTAADVKKAPRGAILKSDAEKYILADDDIIAVTSELAISQEKVDLLKSILNNLNKRSYTVKNAIDFLRFKNGA